MGAQRLRRNRLPAPHESMLFPVSTVPTAPKRNSSTQEPPSLYPQPPSHPYGKERPISGLTLPQTQRPETVKCHRYTHRLSTRLSYTSEFQRNSTGFVGDHRRRE